MTIASLFAAIADRIAPFGYQDAHGFHYGVPQIVPSRSPLRDADANRGGCSPMPAPVPAFDPRDDRLRQSQPRGFVHSFHEGASGTLEQCDHA